MHPAFKALDLILEAHELSPHAWDTKRDLLLEALVFAVISTRWTDGFPKKYWDLLKETEPPSP